MYRSLLAVVLITSPLAAQFDGFWETRTSLRIARQESAAAVLGGKVYVSGGLLANRTSTKTVEVQDPKTRSWSRIADMPLALHHHGFCATGGKLYQIGGYQGSSFSPTARCHAWDPATKTWTRIADLPRARGAFVAVAIAGKIYAAGGVEQAFGVSNTLAIYDPATNKWRFGRSMPTRREHLAAAALGGRLYVAGGRVGLTNSTVLERYDSRSDTWTTLAPMPTARGGNGAAVLDGKLIVVGGEQFGPRKVFKETEEYDPATNTWRTMRDMKIPVHGIYPVTIGDEILVAGGGLVAGFGVTNAVTALRRLPTGVTRYGRSTPACKGAIRLSVNAGPRAGNNGFAFVSSATAPPLTGGLLVLGGKRDLAGTRLLGFDLHVGLKAPLILLAAQTDASGTARLQVPVPAGSRGLRLFGQFVLTNTRACRGQGPLSATDGIGLVVQ